MVRITNILRSKLFRFDSANRLIGRDLILSVLVVMLFQTVPVSAAAGAELDYYLDYARFRGDDQFQFVEIYFGITRDGFLYSPEGDRFSARIKIQVDVLLNDSLISNQSWETKDFVDSLGVIQPGQLFHDVYGLYLKTGSYHVRTVVSDLNRVAEKVREFDLNMPSADKKSLTISDVQLATHISRDTTQNRFFKNGFRIIPNPSVSYGSAMPILFYYLEIYNLSPLHDGADSTYRVTVRFRDQKGSVVKEMPAKTAVRKASSLVDVGNYFVGSLSSGYYEMQIETVDCASRDTAVTVKRLNIFRLQDMAPKSEDVQSGTGTREAAYLGMDEESLDLYFEYAGYVAGREEKKTYKTLDAEGKRRYLMEFWTRRDPDPSTPQNEFEEDYYNRVRLAIQRFSSGYKEGWKTDRGRVLVIYGEPDDTQRSMLGSGSKNYEIWQYNQVEGGVEFVFLDESGYGDYRLVHSTATNEIHDESWQNN